MKHRWPTQKEHEDTLSHFTMESTKIDGYNTGKENEINKLAFQFNQTYNQMNGSIHSESMQENLLGQYVELGEKIDAIIKKK